MVVSEADFGMFNRQVHIGRDQAFLTIGNGFGNQEALLWEGQFATQYAIAHKSKPWALVFNPKAVIRMVDGESFPLRPPSFHVDVSYHRLIQSTKEDKFQKLWYFGIGHHSNGQSGIFYLPGDSVVNLENGNFAQNNLETGLQLFRNEHLSNGSTSFQFLNIYARITPKFSAEWSGVETLDRLGFYRPFITYGVGGRAPESASSNVFQKLKANSNLILSTGYIIGEMRGQPENNLDKRLIIDAQYQYVLPFFKDLAFMARYYRGQDYYNIRFSNTLSVLTLGFSSNIGTIKAPVSYVGAN